ncbi:hypothetical protein GCM10010404_22930 [Nonomuraea africana]
MWSSGSGREGEAAGEGGGHLACSADLGLLLIPQDLGLAARVALLAGGVLLNGLSVAVYVGARFGPGPRDGLMTGAAAATGRSMRDRGLRTAGPVDTPRTEAVPRLRSPEENVWRRRPRGECVRTRPARRSGPPVPPRWRTVEDPPGADDWAVTTFSAGPPR